MNSQRWKQHHNRERGRKRRSSQSQRSSGINEVQWARRLVHHALLAVVVRVLHGVELVHERGLASLGVNLRVVAGGGRTVTSTSGTGGGVRVTSLEVTLALADALTEGLATSGVRAGQASAGGVRAGKTVAVGAVRVGGVRASEAGAGGDTGGGGVGATNSAGLTLEAIVTLLAAGQDTTLLLKVGHGDGGKSRGSVVLGGVVVNLVNGDGGVDNVRLDGLLVDNGLDGLVDVVVDVLTADGGCNRLRVHGLDLGALVSKLGSLGSETLLDLGIVAVLERAVLDGGKVVVVLLGENLAVLDGLDGSVVVVLVNLLVDGGLDLLVLLELMALVGDSRGDLLVDGGVVVAGAGPEDDSQY